MTDTARVSRHFVADANGARYETDSPKPRTGRIVVGVDGSPSSLAAIVRGTTIATALGASLELVTTWRYETGYAYFGAPEWSPERDARQISADAIAVAFPSGLPAWAKASFHEGRSAQSLINASVGAEMLILGSRGHGGMEGLLLGSVSAACAERATCPVLIVH